MVDNNSPATQIVDPTDKIWGSSLTPAGCPVCGQAFLVPPDRVGSRCPNCALGTLAEQPARLRNEPPELILPFQIRPEQMAVSLDNFCKEVWLRPEDFNPESLIKRAAPVFMPMWLVDCDVNGTWQAEAGFDYQVESSRENYSNQGWRSNKVVETRQKWEPRLGQISRHYDNAAAPAVSDYAQVQNRLGNYPLNQSGAYRADLLGKAVLRIPDLQPQAAWPLAQDQINRIVAGNCQTAGAAQHIRNVSIHAEYLGQNWTQLLLPFYSTFYTADDGQPRVVWINAQTGVVSGVQLASQSKGWRWAGILAGIGLTLFLLGLLLTAFATLIPPMVMVGGLLIFMGFGAVIGAFVPAIWPWQWNRRQQEQKVVSQSG
jgi:hypothetical protein